MSIDSHPNLRYLTLYIKAYYIGFLVKCNFEFWFPLGPTPFLNNLYAPIYCNIDITCEYSNLNKICAVVDPLWFRFKKFTNSSCFINQIVYQILDTCNLKIHGGQHNRILNFNGDSLVLEENICILNFFLYFFNWSIILK